MRNILEKKGKTDWGMLLFFFFFFFVGFYYFIYLFIYFLADFSLYVACIIQKNKKTKQTNKQNIFVLLEGDFKSVLEETDFLQNNFKNRLKINLLT